MCKSSITFFLQTIIQSVKSKLFFVKINILTAGFVKMKYLQSVLLNMLLVSLIRLFKIADK